MGGSDWSQLRGGTESRDRSHRWLPRSKSRETTPSMKHLWLILGVLLALGATAAQVKKKRKCKTCLNGTFHPGAFHPGGFSVLSLGRDPETAIFNLTEAFTLPTLEFGKLLETRLNVRTKRESLILRRGRKRIGPRPTCRGCYSWLTIVAPPGQETDNGTLVAPPGPETHNGTLVALPGQETHNETSSQSFSESEERSSEGD
ncbi:uncharacterized protein M6D78_018368 [Vipera latastei]